MIAALFVRKGGVYFNVPDVDPWDQRRDARLYWGPFPVVAHPPCQRWGRYWFGGPSSKVRRQRGDDGGCFSAAIASVRRWGGVLEHPAYSSAWEAFEIFAPPAAGGWITAGDGVGWTCHVEQGHYEHRARKATWLYAARVPSLPSLRWGRSRPRARVDGCGFHTTEERIAKLGGMNRRQWLEARGIVTDRMSSAEAAATPIPFRDLLISIARSVDPELRAGIDTRARQVSERSRPDDDGDGKPKPPFSAPATDVRGAGSLGDHPTTTKGARP